MDVTLSITGGNVHVQFYKGFSAPAIIRFYRESDLTEPVPGHPAGQPKTPWSMSTNVADLEVGNIDFWFTWASGDWTENDKFCALVYNQNSPSTSDHLGASNLTYLWVY